MSSMSNEQRETMPSCEERARELLGRMNLAEKIGQLSQVNCDFHELNEAIRAGGIGSVLNEVNVDRVNELQHVAVNESRLGIPLLIGRDVIHGFKTIFPIPLGQAASWNPELVQQAAAISAAEAASTGVNWTFAPMIDITRDPRWGRIAESLGEDPVLCSQLGSAMVRGFQGAEPAEVGSIAACAKHFAGYGAAEGGLDYNTTNISEHELRNVYLRPFKAALDAGVMTFMAAFNDLNGVPASGNAFLMKQVLRDEWDFDGMVVSDWDSVHQLSVHGYTEGDRDAALAAASAGVDMEMASRTYADHLPSLIEAGAIAEQDIDQMVHNVLVTKFRLGLFENPFTDPQALPPVLDAAYLEVAKRAAVESCVLLKNSAETLPLDRGQVSRIALIGTLANDGYEQLGTWVFDGEALHSQTCLEALQNLTGDEVEVHWAAGLEHPRSYQHGKIPEAVELAANCDAIVVVAGEESILSGEAHCRADIGLPGAQAELIAALAETGKPLILVVMAGRPLTLGNVIDRVDAVLYAWHPGTMGGPAIAELLLGEQSPSGKLPVTFPAHVGQIPIYYAHKNTGRPPSDDSITHIDNIDGGAAQTSLGMSAFHLDTGFRPAFPFGFGLSYADFEYRDIEISANRWRIGDSVEISATVHNRGSRDATEVAQLYVRDLVGSVTRPVRELKGFQRIPLLAGESRRVSFTLTSAELAFFGNNMNSITEPGRFEAWIGGDSTATLGTDFELLAAESAG
jgi:beta-glucosidase